MQIENLTDENVKELEKKVTDLIKENPDIKFKTFPMDDTPDEGIPDRVLLQKILEEVEALHRFFKLTFDMHVLINGKFVQYPKESLHMNDAKG